MKTTTFIRPECDGETARMLAETVRVIEDSRVTSVILTMGEALLRRKPPDDRYLTDVSKGCVLWQDILPAGQNNPAYRIRTQYGWTDGELHAVRSLLVGIEAELLCLADADGILDSTSETLDRDAERCYLLRNRWPAAAPRLPKEGPDGENV